MLFSSYSSSVFPATSLGFTFFGEIFVSVTIFFGGGVESGPMCKRSHQCGHPQS